MILVSQGTIRSPMALAKLVGCLSVMRRAAHLFIRQTTEDHSLN